MTTVSIGIQAPWIFFWPSFLSCWEIVNDCSILHDLWVWLYTLPQVDPSLRSRKVVSVPVFPLSSSSLVPFFMLVRPSPGWGWALQQPTVYMSLGMQHYSSTEMQLPGSCGQSIPPSRYFWTFLQSSPQPCCCFPFPHSHHCADHDWSSQVLRKRR